MLCITSAVYYCEVHYYSAVWNRHGLVYHNTLRYFIVLYLRVPDRMPSVSDTIMYSMVSDPEPYGTVSDTIHNINIPYHTAPYCSMVWYSNIHACSIVYHAPCIQYRAVLYILLCCAALCCTKLFCTVTYSVVPWHVEPHVPYYKVLYCTPLRNLFSFFLLVFN